MSGSGAVNFDGGTLRAGVNSTVWMQGLGSSQINSRGVTIDTQGFAVTIGQSLLAPTGSGLTAVALSGSGAGVNRGAGGGEFFVDGDGCDVAVRDIDDVESRALAEEADGRRRGGVARRIKMRGNLRAVAVGFGRADDGINRVDDAGHVLKQLGDLTLFPNELFGVSEVLVLAAAAAGKQRANGRDAVG